MTPRPVTALAPRQGSLERLPLLADHSAASAARIISARFAFVSGARASRLVILGPSATPEKAGQAGLSRHVILATQKPPPSACRDNKNPIVSAGCVSNLCPSGGSTTQGCALRVQKCAVGRSQEVSSRVPAPTRRNAVGDGVPGFDPLQMIVAHSGQIHRVAVRPLSVMRWIGRGSPPERWKASSATMNDIENALPKRRWQLVQWQV